MSTLKNSANDPDERFYHRDTSYLEVIVKPVLAALAVTLTAGEVVAKVAGGFSAVGSKHRGDFVSGISTGVSHDARTCGVETHKSVNKTVNK